MQKQMFFSLSMAALFMFACEPPIVFDKPQPADVAAIGAFPKRIQGKYISSSDSSFLQITGSSLIRIYDFYQKTHVTQLDSNQQIIGDTLFDLITNRGQFIQFEGDSIVEHINETYTIFTIDKLNILKKYKGYYFANIKETPNTWQVKEMEFSHGKLIFSSINKKEDLEQLKQITESASDTMPYVFSPTRKEFKKFIQNNGFRDNEEFMKIWK